MWIYEIESHLHEGCKFRFPPLLYTYCQFCLMKTSKSFLNTFLIFFFYKNVIIYTNGNCDNCSGTVGHIIFPVESGKLHSKCLELQSLENLFRIYILDNIQRIIFPGSSLAIESSSSRRHRHSQLQKYLTVIQHLRIHYLYWRKSRNALLLCHLNICLL